MSDTNTTSLKGDPDTLADTQRKRGVDINDLMKDTRSETPSSEQALSRSQGSTLISLVAELTRGPAFTFAEQYKQMVSSYATSINLASLVDHRNVQLQLMSGVDELVNTTARRISSQAFTKAASYLFETQSLLPTLTEQARVAGSIIGSFGSRVADQTEALSTALLIKSTSPGLASTYIREIMDVKLSAGELLITPHST